MSLLDRTLKEVVFDLFFQARGYRGVSDEKQAFKTREISVHECTTLDENTFSQHINCITDYFSKQGPMFQCSQDNFYQNLRKDAKRTIKL